MRAPTLKERVAALENAVADIVARLERREQPKREKDWRRTLGMFAGDPIMKEIIEEGRKIREADRKRAKR